MRGEVGGCELRATDAESQQDIHRGGLTYLISPIFGVVKVCVALFGVEDEHLGLGKANNGREEGKLGVHGCVRPKNRKQNRVGNPRKAKQELAR